MNNKFAEILRSQGLYPLPDVPFPVRAAAGQALTNEEVARIVPRYTPHVRIFDLSNAEHLKDYTDVLDRCLNKAGVKLLGQPREVFVPEKLTWMVLAQWTDVEGELPARRRWQ